ncbi:MMPL family transporter [Modestobacter sp. I12A-02628]|uniref:MMPL family transporter n=1 Tax=Goekera deserti TaxID=2497753 RepID=A0A7K3WG60_9ACTN|nr:MMPL family transporter [Goekera deserti]MPQ96571.1 MMPL family transporter [Goekera deserti]NDI47117.1 MMPL family transporter [Goekera deserti]NEL55485.1 MMPL family transporter [Goekera deserti]
MLASLTRTCARHRALVVVWLAVLVGGVLAAPALFGRLTAAVGSVESSESVQAAEDLWQAAPSGGQVYAVADGLPADQLRPEVERVTAAIAALPGVTGVATPWTTGDPALTAEDGRAVALGVQFEPRDELAEGTVDEAVRLLRSLDAPRVLVGGGMLLDQEMNDQAAADLARAELFSLPVVLVLLVVLFGGVVAAGLPVVVALVGVAATLLALLLVSVVTDVSVYAVNIVTMLGLGLAVDYALLVVARFREERAVDPGVAGALARTMATAGRTVAFSGATVAAALAALLVFPDPFLRSIGAAGLSVVLLDLLAALTLLPALLARVGGRIAPAAPTASSGGLFARAARLAGRRPALVVLATAAVLALAGAPFLGAVFADPDARSLPASSASRQLTEIADERFPAGTDVDPVTVVAPAGTDLTGYARAVRELPGVRTVTERTVPGFTVLDVLPEGDSQGPTAMRLVDEVRALDAPATVRVTGDAAFLTDYQDALVDRMPWALLVLLGTTTVLLFLFTGSLVVPLTAIVLSTLSLGATFGALVWVFQDGNLGALVGTEALGSLSITTPVLVFAIAFGLSMDYEVFLLGRISEIWRATGDTDRALREGLARTARTVTSAGLLLVVVFAGFVAGGFSPVKQVGLGLVLAVLADITLVRMLLLPAVMTLLGRANWWAPAPLRRWHARHGITEEPAVPQPAVSAA